MKRAATTTVAVVIATLVTARPATADSPPHEHVYESRSYYKNFVPFGVGQFQNGDTAKGDFFMYSQAITAVVSIAIFGYIHTYYTKDGYVPIEHASTARTLQRVQVGSSIAFYGLVVWGIIDAVVHYRSLVRVPGGPPRATTRHGISDTTLLAATFNGAKPAHRVDVI